MKNAIKRRRGGIKLPHTPITEDTFIRQGWRKIVVDDGESDASVGTSGVSGDIRYYTLPIPKNRNDDYTPFLISNATDETDVLLELGLQPNMFFVEIMNTDGLGFCTTEEELEILYRALTGDFIE